jgi:hypothetical protein
MQADPLGRPENPIAHPVRKIDQLRLVQLHDSGVAKIEPCVVVADDAIMVTHPVQIFWSLDSSGNDGVGINHSTWKSEWGRNGLGRQKRQVLAQVSLHPLEIVFAGLELELEDQDERMENAHQAAR